MPSQAESQRKPADSARGRRVAGFRRRRRPPARYARRRSSGRSHVAWGPPRSRLLRPRLVPARPEPPSAPTPAPPPRPRYLLLGAQRLRLVFGPEPPGTRPGAQRRDQQCYRPEDELCNQIGLADEAQSVGGREEPVVDPDRRQHRGKEPGAEPAGQRRAGDREQEGGSTLGLSTGPSSNPRPAAPAGPRIARTQPSARPDDGSAIRSP